MHEPGKLCRPASGTNNHNRYDHYNPPPEDFPLKYVNLYTPEAEEHGDTLPPPSTSIGDSSINIVIAKTRTLSDVFVDFCSRTSSHGIPHIASSPTFFGKTFWTVVFLACSIAFTYQTYLTVKQYTMSRTIIEMELKFDPEGFPAVTICNLNPFKNSMLSNDSTVNRLYTQYLEHLKASIALRNKPLSRSKRQVNYYPIRTDCRCLSASSECVLLHNANDSEATMCICFRDAHSGHIWPCYHEIVWTTKMCSNCSLTNSCDMPEEEAADRALEEETAEGVHAVQCVCQDISKKCVKVSLGGIQYFKPVDYSYYETPPTTETPLPTTTVNLSGSPFEHAPTNLNPDVAATIVKNGIYGYILDMDEDKRRSLSYSLEELIVWSSFNAETCNESCFDYHFYITYGNCYTFNSKAHKAMRSSRGGPAYGLRALINVHQDDYFPLTEAAGVRIVVHDQKNHPFPDSLGYSAPTGVVSSFGLKCQKMSRIRSCRTDYPPNYRYRFDESYSTEGCYRSCFQHHVLRKCECGDPRFPVNKTQGEQTCRYENEKGRQCHAEFFANFSKATGHTEECSCLQPCYETIYQASYSAATWPAERFEIHQEQICPEDVIRRNACSEYVRTNTALIEIYFEQLTYEDLNEVEDYDIVKLLSDFGGNIGLWIGFSAITFVEFLELALELVKLGYWRSKEKAARKKRHQMRYSRPVAFQYVNRVAEESFQQEQSSVDDSDDRFHYPQERFQYSPSK